MADLLVANFEKIYREFRLQLYKDIFKIINQKKGALSALEFFSAEVIFLLGKPTISEVAEFLDISSSHATYRLKSLIEKGFVEKFPSAEDGRVFTLATTKKFDDFYHKEDYYGTYIMKKLSKELEPENRDIISNLLELILTQIDLKKGDKQ